MKFSYQNLGISEKDNNGRRYTIFNFENEKSSILAKYTKIFFLLLKPKVVHLHAKKCVAGTKKHIAVSAILLTIFVMLDNWL